MGLLFSSLSREERVERNRDTVVVSVSLGVSRARNIPAATDVCHEKLLLFLFFFCDSWCTCLTKRRAFRVMKTFSHSYVDFSKIRESHGSDSLGGFI